MIQAPLAQRLLTLRPDVAFDNNVFVDPVRRHEEPRGPDSAAIPYRRNLATHTMWSVLCTVCACRRGLIHTIATNAGSCSHPGAAGRETPASLEAASNRCSRVSCWFYLTRGRMGKPITRPRGTPELFPLFLLQTVVGFYELSLH